MPRSTPPKKVALITGGAHRIGKGIAIHLAQKGYSIALHYNRSYTAARATAETIRSYNIRCELFQADLCNELETCELIPTVLTKFKNISLLINNASIFTPSELKTIELRDWNKTFMVNVTAPHILAASFAQNVKKGLIINLLDQSVCSKKTKYSAYLLAKKELEDLTYMSAVQFAPGIRVNGIAPGIILAPKGKTIAALQTRIRKIPLKRKGTISDITKTVMFFLDNQFVTGQVVYVDGGEHLL